MGQDNVIFHIHGKDKMITKDLLHEHVEQTIFLW